MKQMVSDQCCFFCYVPWWKEERRPNKWHCCSCPWVSPWNWLGWYHSQDKCHWILAEKNSRGHLHQNTRGTMNLNSSLQLPTVWNPIFNPPGTYKSLLLLLLLIINCLSSPYWSLIDDCHWTAYLNYYYYYYLKKTTTEHFYPVIKYNINIIFNIIIIVIQTLSPYTLILWLMKTLEVDSLTN